jgi:DNA (cytosine-5)-methyltransferase 1
MWKEMARIIGEVRPKYAFIENSPMLTSRGLGTVLGDLAQMGFDAEWGVLSAADVGANHKRERIWIVGKMANSCKQPISNKSNCRSNFGFNEQQGKRAGNTNGVGGKKNVSNPSSIGQQGQGKYEQSIDSTQNCQRKANYVESIGRREFWSIEPSLGRVANGVAYRLDRLKSIGNGQVPLCAATAWKLLKERLDGHKQRGMEKHL